MNNEVPFKNSDLDIFVNHFFNDSLNLPIILNTLALRHLVARCKAIVKVEKDGREKIVEYSLIKEIARRFIFDLGCDVCHFFHFSFYDGSIFKVYIDCDFEEFSDFIQSLLLMNECNRSRYGCYLSNSAQSAYAN